MNCHNIHYFKLPFRYQSENVRNMILSNNIQVHIKKVSENTTPQHLEYTLIRLRAKQLPILALGRPIGIS